MELVVELALKWAAELVVRLAAVRALELERELASGRVARMGSARTSWAQRESALKASEPTAWAQMAWVLMAWALVESGQMVRALLDLAQSVWVLKAWVLMGPAPTAWVLMAPKMLAWHQVLGALVSCPELEEQEWVWTESERMVLAPMESAQKAWDEKASASVGSAWTAWALMESARTESVL
jgi:hypothetical protein